MMGSCLRVKHQWRYLMLGVALTGLFLPALPGCSSSTEDAAATHSPAAEAPARSTPGALSRPQRGRSGPGRLETSSARPESAAAMSRLDAQQAAARVLASVSRSARFRPTLVVWLLDISPSAMAWGREIHQAIHQFYAQDVAQWKSADRPLLETALWTISQSVETPLAPTSDPQEVLRALDRLAVDPRAEEHTFTAVQLALEQYLPVRTKDRKELILVIITDEAGNDWPLVDELVLSVRTFAIPVYVIGVPAPFGRRAALSAEIEAGGTPPGEPTSSSDEPNGPILQGPESRELERIRLAFSGYDADLELLDSGFGPFGLECLSRSSGGLFLAVRSMADQGFSIGGQRLSWPAEGLPVPDPEIMEPYRPAWRDAAAYQAELAGNRAWLALHQAALLPPAEVLRDPQLLFVKRDEADLKNQLDRAQQAAAKVAPGVDQLYELLQEGAVDAPRLTAPRARAGFDLALGRVCAAKARIDGYNAMLAALKRGRSFENEDSTTWVLQRASSTDLSSSLQKLIERATTLLQGVVDQHPGTPWAELARHELQEPLGWEWKEQP